MVSLRVLINKLKDSYSIVRSQDINLRNPSDASLASFKDQKETYVRNTINSSLRQLRDIIWRMPSEDNTVFVELYRKLEDNRLDAEVSLSIIEKMAEMAARAREPREESLKLKVPNLPADIRADMAADIMEVQRCFNSGCYRSATILCGRILETALHRVYYEVTGKDILETNPGIGLGSLIAKLSDKNVAFDPGLTQQIHLINQVRIFSVHKKQDAFTPSKSQANAMILYTLDVLEKMFN